MRSFFYAKKTSIFALFLVLILCRVFADSENVLEMDLFSGLDSQSSQSSGIDLGTMDNAFSGIDLGHLDREESPSTDNDNLSFISQSLEMDLKGLLFYIHENLAKVNGKKVEVTADFVNLRVLPEPDASILNTAKKGDVFDFVSWSNADSTGDRWIRARIAEAYDDGSYDNTVDATVKVNTRLRVRKTPPDSKGRYGEIIDHLSNGTRVKVDLEKSVDNWYFIFYSGKNGFSHSDYIVLDSAGKTGTIASLAQTEKVSDERENSSSEPEFSGSSSTRTVHKRADGGIEIRGVPQFFQGKTDPYDPAGTAGWRPFAYCGPTSFQMVLSSHGVQKSRDYLALTRLDRNGKVVATNYKSSSFDGQMYAKGTGTAYGPMIQMAKHLGFKNTKQHNPSLLPGSSRTSMKDLLETGRPQIVSARGLMKFSDGSQYRTGGHVFVVTGITANGDVFVNDPAKNGGQKMMKKQDFLKVWGGFTIDVAP